MKEIKIIDLLNKIANGEEAPQKIKYDNTIYKYDEQYDYQNKLQINYYSIDEGGDFFNNVFCYSLNDEVEIIEDKKETYYNKDFMPVEEDNKITPQDVGNLGYACNIFRKCFEKGWKKCEEDNNKIEKIDITDKSICVKGTRFFRDKDIEIFQKLSMVINEIIDKINKDDRK